MDGVDVNQNTKRQQAMECMPGIHIFAMERASEFNGPDRRDKNVGSSGEHSVA